MSKLTEERKQQIWDEILANPGYSRNVNRSNLENIKNMDAIDKKCLELLEKCMEKKMSVDTIVQVVNVSYLQEEKADYILNELLKIVDKSTEIQLRQKLSDLLVC